MMSVLTVMKAAITVQDLAILSALFASIVMSILITLGFAMKSVRITTTKLAKNA